MSLQEKDQAAEAVAVAPRVSLADIEAKIARKHFARASALVEGDELHADDAPLELLTLCVLVTTNGFTVIGKSGAVSPENFNEELGHRIAYDDCLSQLWPLEGYLLREELSRTEESNPEKERVRSELAKLHAEVDEAKSSSAE